MDINYSTDVYWKLEQEFQGQALDRPMRLERYEAGAELEYVVTGVEKVNQANVRLKIDRFVGGGFAGQVYRVKVLDISSLDGEIGALTVGGVYAMKILIPPSGFSKPIGKPGLSILKIFRIPGNFKASLSS